MIPFIPTIYADDTTNLVVTIIVTAFIGLMLVSLLSMVVVQMPFINEVIHCICAGVIIFFSFKIYGEITWADWWKYFLIRYFALVIWMLFIESEILEDRWDPEKEMVVTVKVKADFLIKELLAIPVAGLVIFITDGLLPLTTDGTMWARFTFLGWFGIIFGMGSFFFVGREIFRFVERRKQK